MMFRPRFTNPHPLVVALLAMCVMSGIAGAIDPSAGSNTINTLLPGYAVLWNSLLAFGGIVSLVGVVRDQGVLIERAGMIILAGLFLSFGTGLRIVDDTWFSTGSGLILSIGVGCLWRAHQITQQMRQRMRQLRGEE